MKSKLSLYSAFAALVRLFSDYIDSMFRVSGDQWQGVNKRSRPTFSSGWCSYVDTCWFSKCSQFGMLSGFSESIRWLLRCFVNVSTTVTRVWYESNNILHPNLWLINTVQWDHFILFVCATVSTSISASSLWCRELYDELLWLIIFHIFT